MGRSIGKILGGIGLILVGLTMIEVVVTDPESEMAAIVSCVIFGALFILCGILLIWLGGFEIKQASGGKLGNVAKGVGAELKDAVLPGYEAANDKNDFERMLTRFRTNYSSFFATTYAIENASVQKDITQMYLNILEFRRNRLRRLGLVCDYKSARKNYTGSIHKDTYFDGKYEITEVKEDIAARTSYLKDGRNIYSRTDKQIARYTMLNAKRGELGKIICPNCGVPETRENLLDGCDSCGTKFIIEDLGKKVSDFGYRSDYRVQYGKYKEVRSKMTVWVALIIALVCFAFCMFWSIKVAPEVAAEEQTGVFSIITATLFAALFPTAAFTFLGVLAFYFVVFPFVQIGASATHLSKSVLNKLKNSHINDENMQKEIRKYDKLFSANAFYSSIQNKLSSIHFSDTQYQINAFTTFDLSYMLDSYKNVVDMDTDYISIKNYYVDPQSQLQIAEVEAYLKLTEYDSAKNKCKTRNEKLMLMLSKSAACKTQAVCAPALLRCKGCGSGITLLNGRVCPQCGTDINLERYDWVVRGYKTI